MKVSPWLFLLASAALAAPQEAPTARREAAGAGKARDVIRLPAGPPGAVPEAGIEKKVDRPPVQPPDASRKLVKGSARREPVEPSTAAATSGSLGAVRLVAMSPGEARLLVAGGEQTLRPGDPFGSDRVRAVGGGVVVLDRPAVPGQPGGEATVVLRFDASGRPRVRVYHVEDPTPVTAPGVR